MNTDHSLTAVFVEIPPEGNGDEPFFEVTDFQVIIETDTYVIESCSNSTVSELVFNTSLGEIQFNVAGTSGTIGICNITIPSQLMSGDFLIYLDNKQLIKDADYIETYTGTHNSFSITYEHSTHTIEIRSTNIIPEFSSFIILPLTLSPILVAIILRKRMAKT